MTNKSTNVRIEMMRRALRMLGAVSGRLAGELGRHLFLAPPPRRRSTAAETAILARGDRFTVRSGRERLAAWRFGHGPVIVLVHGWGGDAAQLAHFVDPLVEIGFSVVAYDGIGHGRSTGAQTSLVHLAESLLDVAKRVGPIGGLVTHSVGGAAASIAMARGLPIERAVFIAPPADAKVWFDRFASFMQLDGATRAASQERIEEYVGIPFARLNAETMGRNLRVELLVIHDRNDKEVAFGDGQRIASLGRGRLIETEGLGHRRILSDPKVVDAALRHFSPNRPTFEEVLNEELFDPSVRPSAA